MRLPLILILLGAAMPASVLAQGTPAEEAQTAEAAAPAAQPGATATKPAARLQPAARKKQAAAARNWSLDKAVNKKQQQQARQQERQQRAEVAGPAMPAEPVVKVPRQRTAKAAPREKKPKINGTQVLAPLLRKGRN